MEKYSYLVIDTEQGGKCAAYVQRIANCNNLIGFLSVPGVVSVNIADTKKDAEKIARFWNDEYKRQGRFLYE